MANDIDNVFYDRFLTVCDKRLGRMNELLGGSLGAEDLESIELELHAFAGEATLLGFAGLARVANDLQKHLSKLSGDPSEKLAGDIRKWFEGLTKAAKRAADGASPGEDEKDIEGLATGLAEMTSEGELQRVLIIDDSEIIRELLAASLREHGHPVATAENLMEFEILIKEFEPEIILTDINMPDIQGDEICRVLKQRYETEGIPIVLFSSLPDEELARRAERAGADGYLSKEHGIDRLVEMLDELLGSILF